MCARCFVLLRALSSFNSDWKPLGCNTPDQYVILEVANDELKKNSLRTMFSLCDVCGWKLLRGSTPSTLFPYVFRLITRSWAHPETKPFLPWMSFNAFNIQMDCMVCTIRGKHRTQSSFHGPQMHFSFLSYRFNQNFASVHIGVARATPYYKFDQVI